MFEDSNNALSAVEECGDMNDVVLPTLVHGFVNSCTYALLALGYALIYNTSRIFHIAHGATYTVSGYVLYVLMVSCRWPLWVTLVATIVIAGVFGITLDRWLYRPIASGSGSLLPAFIASLGFYTAAVNVVALVFGSETKVVAPGIASTIGFGNVILTRIQVSQLLAGVLCSGTLLVLLRVTRWGRTVRAVRDNTQLARVLGVNVSSVRLGVFALGSALAGLAAFMTALDVGIDPYGGITAVLAAAIAMTVGGTGTFAGPVIGAVLLGCLESLLVLTIGTRWMEALAFTVLFLILIARPGGLIHYVRRLEERAA